jgi:hypothetical protein
MTLLSSVDIINELPSLVNWILVIGCRFDATNSEMIGGCGGGHDDDEVAPSLRP